MAEIVPLKELATQVRSGMRVAVPADYCGVAMAATAAIIAVYFSLVALIGGLFHTAWPSGLLGEIMAIVIAVFLF